MWWLTWGFTPLILFICTIYFGKHIWKLLLPSNNAYYYTTHPNLLNTFCIFPLLFLLVGFCNNGNLLNYFLLLLLQTCEVIELVLSLGSTHIWRMMKLFDLYVWSVGSCSLLNSSMDLMKIFSSSLWLFWRIEEL